MEIAKGVQASEYLSLDLNNHNSPNWDKAFEYFRSRITDRFIEPADKLVEFEQQFSPSEKKYGFAVLALDCLLCETIQAFYEGIGNSHGHSKRLFKAFLMNRDTFKPFFVIEADATKFYEDFRCGILHQAQTGIDTKVWAIGDLIARNGTQVIVNRELFHKNIKIEFDEYLKKLREKKDTDLMDNFKKKMDFIAGR